VREERDIILISCGGKKRSEISKARDLYISSLFQKSLAFTECLNPDHIFILSAKHGLVGLEDTLEPYNHTLNTITRSSLRNWAFNVLEQLSNIADLENDHFLIFSGIKDHQFLTPHITILNCP